MGSRASATGATDTLVAELAAVSREDLAQLLSRRVALIEPALVTRLAELARERVRVNAEESMRIAEAAMAVADLLGDDESRARALRTKANSAWFLNQNRPAVELYEQAIALYQRLGNETEIGRTLSSAIQPLIRLGEYQRAMDGAARAREIFERTGDTLRLRRLELNVANIYHRQDRFAEALELYESAYRRLAELGDTEAIAVALHNMAVCLIGMNDFPRAIATHQEARTFCAEHGMPALVVQADYNISYLYYLRGEYSRALEGLRAAAVAAQATGDAYHRALCSLDQSDIYLELNMREEAAEMAQEAFTQFETLGMNYEAAKSLANQAIAKGRRGSFDVCFDLFSRARALFVQERNVIWPSQIDLYQALVLCEAGRYNESRPLCEQARTFFRDRKVAGKEILCELLLARIALRTGQTEAARGFCLHSLAQLQTTEAPHLIYPAHLLMGQIEEASGEIERALASYRAAQAAVESLRGILRGEELKIAFMNNKQEVYENLVRLSLDHRANGCDAEQVFDTIEQAKSRALRDLVLPQAHSPRPADAPGAADAQEMRTLREELNWYYHRMEAELLGQEPAAETLMAQLQTEARTRERRLIRLQRESAASRQPDGVVTAPPQTIASVRAALGPAASLVEYFRTGDRLVAAVLTADSLNVVSLGPVARLAPVVRLLQFQLSKFLLGPQYIAACKESSLMATQAHLAELYDVLIAPLRRLFRGDSLVFVAHENLHHVPLHALFDGQQYLSESFAISYAPSASIYALCHALPSHRDGSSLVLGVPDARAPYIEEESRMAAEMLPGAELFLGEKATREVLSENGPSSRFLHIGTHGRFRRDEPMFSAIRLGDAYLTLYDLYQMRLPVDLVTLSGCSTGMNVVARGDELLGLVRGLLGAGAKSLMLTLWDVQDSTTSELIKAFYQRLRGDCGKTSALQGAMSELRRQHPHPYYWAPFVLIGSPS